MPPKRASLGDRPLTSSAAPRRTDDTLLGDTIKRQEVEEILLRDIMPNRRQPRSAPEGTNLDDLAASIREHGVVQPIVVRPIPLTLFEGGGRRYELVAGERRWRASALAGKTSIPALVQTLDDEAMLELAIIENLQREDLHPLDEARALGQLRDALGYSLPRIATTVGKSEGYVRNRLRLLSISPDLQTLVMSRPDTLVHVLELARIENDEDRAILLAAVRDDELSYAETKRRVKQLIENRTPPTDRQSVTHQGRSSQGDVYVNTPGQTNKEILSTRITRVSTPPRSVSNEGVYVNTPYDEMVVSESSTLHQLQQYATGLEKLAADPEALADQGGAALAALNEIERAVDIMRRSIEGS